MIFAYFAIAFFLIAALFGIMMITYVWEGKRPPKILAFVHGSFAGTGLILLFIASYYFSSVWISTIILSLAALGGIYLISNDLLKKKVPKNIATLHGILALIGFFTLIVSFLFFVKSGHP